ncbi:hypothetical protein [Celeribacter ethanolicus]|uniref:hypothetical protein n=1 Tax=Celeribacter ethanolicus TaxID=1758178 RepID=UPI0008296D6F|nr:hypothetical protein [Celeribacter ethanolicus]
MRGINLLFQKAIYLCAALSLAACTAPFQETADAGREAFLASIPLRNATEDTLLAQCERALQGKLVQAEALARQGFTSSNPSATTARYEKVFGSSPAAFGKDTLFVMSATIIDISRHNEIVSKGKKNHFGIGCSSSGFQIARVLSYLTSRGYDVQLVERGKFSVRKGSLQFCIIAVQTIYGAHQQTSSVSLVRTP